MELETQMSRNLLLSNNSNEYDRLIFFDFVMPDIGTIHVQWLGGAVYSAKSRQDVLVDADAVIFVADSLPLRFEDNVKALMEFSQYLRKQGLSLKTFPWVIQYTKQDLYDILPVQELQKQLNHYNVPYFEANPVKGIGVFETLRMILQLAVAKDRKA